LSNSVETRFPVDHPTAPGHFPGNPIIPGAVLLDEVVLAISGGGGTAPGAVRSAKFLHPVRPGDRLLIRWEALPDGAARFECLVLDPERLALTGTVKLGG
jgi:3-hydroxymyristoyl/3-hydroxydecanoyl-(acyl carrier protein) dehydratase